MTARASTSALFMKGSKVHNDHVSCQVGPKGQKPASQKQWLAIYDEDSIIKLFLTVDIVWTIV